VVQNWLQTFSESFSEFFFPSPWFKIGYNFLGTSDKSHGNDIEMLTPWFVDAKIFLLVEQPGPKKIGFVQPKSQKV